MALIHCPECGKEISDKAITCIHCGYPLKEVGQTKEQEKTAQIFIKNSTGYDLYLNLTDGRKYYIPEYEEGSVEIFETGAIYFYIEYEIKYKDTSHPIFGDTFQENKIAGYTYNVYRGVSTKIEVVKYGSTYGEYASLSLEIKTIYD